MSISTNVGAMSGYLNSIIKGQRYNQAKDLAKGVMDRIPLIGGKLHGLAHDMEQVLKNMVVPGTLFEELGFKYLGPYDGHDLQGLIDLFEENKNYDGPLLIHVITKKGKGYTPAENKPIWSHGVTPFDIESGEVRKSDKPAPPTYTAVFADALTELAKRDPKIVAVTAAMPEGTGLDKFAKTFPERMFDVGIAEEHAVTFSGGMATQGMKPIAAIYSTFLQRAFDQVFHDVAIMDLPVVFALDRAGIAGQDGPTHHGIYDMAYLRVFPNMVSGRSDAQVRHVVDAVVRRTVLPGAAGAVEREDDRQIHDRDVVEDLVERALQEGRVDRGNRLHPLRRQAAAERHGMFLGDADVEHP